MKRIALLLLAATLGGCASEPPAKARADSTPAVAPLPDSLVLTLPDSTPVWLTAGRIGAGSDGVSCREHGVRIGKVGQGRLVPLLYVQNAPRLESGRLLATLSTNCGAGATYEIDPHTAQPTLRPGAGG